MLNAPRLREFLGSACISDLLKAKGPVDVISTTTDASLSSVLKTLRDNKILSLPVKNEDKEYVGFIDVLDVLTNILLAYSEGEDTTSMQWSGWCSNVDELAKRGEEFGTTKVGSVMNASHADRWCPIEDGTLYQLVEIFAKGVHRVPVINDSGHVKSIVTQSDFVKILNKQMKEELLLEEVGSKTLFELGLDRAGSGVVTMSNKAQAILAFWSMYFSRVMAVAVVDENGRLVGNVSASDIRGLGSEEKPFSSLVQAISTFSPSPLPITCTLSSTLYSVISLLADHRIHRVWVVDDAGKPIGVVSLTDVLKVLERVEPDPGSV